MLKVYFAVYAAVILCGTVYKYADALYLSVRGGEHGQLKICRRTCGPHLILKKLKIKSLLYVNERVY